MHQFSETKVHNLRLASFGHRDIRRLHVAMNDALRMRGIESIGNLYTYINRFSCQHWPPA